jgi:hypothetical protein
LKEHPSSAAPLSREGLARIAPEPSKRWFGAGRAQRKQWEALARASERAGKSLAELDAFPASRFTRPRNPGPGASPAEKADFRAAQTAYNKAFAALRKAVTDQQALEKALADYETSPGLPPESVGRLALAQRSCAFRAGELIAMAAELAGGAQPQSAGVTAADARRALSLQMHGGATVLEAMQAEARELYSALAALEARSDLRGSSAPGDPDAPAGEAAAAPKTPIEEAAGDILRKLTALQDRLDAALKHEADPADPSAPRLVFDEPSFTALSVSLEAAKTRVSALVAPPETIITSEMLVGEFIDAGPLNAFIADAGRRGKALPREALDHLRQASGSLEALKADMLDQLNANGRVNVDLATNPHWQGIRNNIGAAFDLIQDKDASKALYDIAVGIGMYRENLVAADIEGLNAVKAHIDNPAYRPYQTGQYLSLAASGHVSVESLVECSMRGVDPSLVEIRADRDGLVSQRALGAGAINAVTLCRYETADGNPVNLVFKAEHEARRGLSRMRVSGLGYSSYARALDLNAAAGVSAAALGCGQALCRTTAGTHDGRFGMFMELAPGRTAREVFSQKESEDPHSVVSQLRAHPNRYAHVRAKLMQEMCRLEWADLLSGQVDRHQDNYLVDIDLQSGRVQVTGIDNDACFGHAMLGPGVVAHVAEQKIVDSSTLNREEFAAAIRGQGLNQINRPELIDEETYYHLLAIDEREYALNLWPHLRADREALNSAMARLKSAKEYAVNLHVQGRLVSDWTSHTVDGRSLMQVYADQHNREYRRVGPENVHRAVSFFGRCMGYLIRKG